MSYVGWRRRWRNRTPLSKRPRSKWAGISSTPAGVPSMSSGSSNFILHDCRGAPSISVRHSQNDHKNSKLEASKFLKPPQKTPRPKIADLFSGVGGFSLGAARAGFEVAVAIDLDKHAVASHEKNFPHAKHARRNIAKLSGRD